MPPCELLKQSKLHSGYSVCEQCLQKGGWYSTVSFPNTDAPLQTNVMFDKLADPSYQHEPSLLCELNVGVVT
jgi:hypothetical protein